LFNKSAKEEVVTKVLRNGKTVSQKEMVNVLDDSLEGLHGTKIAIDAMIEGAKKGGGSIDSQTVGKLVGINKALREAMEQSSPDYKAAQEAYRQLTREVVSPMQNSLVGVLAKVKDVDAAKAASKMFSNQVIQSPENIRKARMAIQQAEKTDEAYAGAWDGIVTPYLKNSSD
jgi:hypothetical protein